MDKVCFNTNILLFVFLIVFITVFTFIFYVIYKFQNNNANNNLSHQTISPKSAQVSVKLQPNPEYYPEKTYIGERDYNMSSQQVGLVFNDNKTFPIFMNRSGRDFYYHVIDDTRNNIRIPLLNNKKTELYDKDSIVIPELNFTGTVKLYENSSSFYTPNI